MPWTGLLYQISHPHVLLSQLAAFLTGGRLFIQCFLSDILQIFWHLQIMSYIRLLLERSIQVQICLFLLIWQSIPWVTKKEDKMVHKGIRYPFALQNYCDSPFHQSHHPSQFRSSPRVHPPIRGCCQYLHRPMVDHVPHAAKIHPTPRWPYGQCKRRISKKKKPWTCMNIFLPTKLEEN